MFKHKIVKRTFPIDQHAHLHPLPVTVKYCCHFIQSNLIELGKKNKYTEERLHSDHVEIFSRLFSLYSELSVQCGILCIRLHLNITLLLNGDK